MKDLSHIYNNILDAIPLDLQDSVTNKPLPIGGYIPLYSEQGSYPVKLNKWASIRLPSEAQLKLRLSGDKVSRKTNEKSIRNYRISDSGSIPDTFWTVLRSHTIHNITRDIANQLRVDRVKNCWPRMQEYIEVTGFTYDDWNKKTIMRGEGGNLTLHSIDMSVSITLSVVPSGDIKINNIHIDQRTLSPLQISSLLEIVGKIRPEVDDKAVKVMEGGLFNDF